MIIHTVCKHFKGDVLVVVVVVFILFLYVRLWVVRSCTEVVPCSRLFLFKKQLNDFPV